MVEVSLSAVSERDVDLLLVEELATCEPFAQWFLSRAGFGPDATLVKVAHSVSTASGDPTAFSPKPALPAEWSRILAEAIRELSQELAENAPRGGHPDSTMGRRIARPAVHALEAP